MRRERQKKRLTQADLRALASAGLTVTRYDASGERAVIQQLAPEGFERRKEFARRLTDNTQASGGKA